MTIEQKPFTIACELSNPNLNHMDLDPHPTLTYPSYSTRPLTSSAGQANFIPASTKTTTKSIAVQLTVQPAEPNQNLAVSTDDANASNSSQWFYKPYLQPSSISTTATSISRPMMSPAIAAAINEALQDSTFEYTPALITILPTRTRITNSPYATLQSTLVAGTVLGPTPRPRQNSNSSATTHPNRAAGPYSSQLPTSIGTVHLNHQPHPQMRDRSTHYNPYRPPSHTNSRAFVPPKVPGYEFVGGSQAGNMGLMMGKRISDGVPVTGKMHQSQVLLQHEYRILKRLKINNAKYIPYGPYPPQLNASDESEPEEAATSTDGSVDSKGSQDSSHRKCRPKRGAKKIVYETGSVETEKYFNRVVEDFIDLDQEGMSILIMERLGYNLLSHTHHTFSGLEGIEGLNNAETKSLNLESPFPDVYTFLVFALKAASILEALMSTNLAHLAICPTALHWAIPETKIESRDSEEGSASDQDGSSNKTEPPSGPQNLHSLLKDIDINDTTIRLFDFTHSKILSHERARAPNNIAEWQIPGYLEYHLQFLAPEQTGRAETWMDHRTDIYGLGTTLFSLLTMQYPNTGDDSVQILQATKPEISKCIRAQARHPTVPERAAKDRGDEDDNESASAKSPVSNNADHYIFEDDIVSLRSQVSAKIPLSSKTLLRTPTPLYGAQSIHRGTETADPIVRVVFVSGASGVGKTFLIRGMAAVARNSGLFAGGVFEAESSVPYSAILSCIQSVLQQLLTQHTDAIASLIIAIQTAFEPNSGIGIICDLVPELRIFFNGSVMPESKDVPLTHSIARFHALILKLIRVISTHFFMTWLIDDLQFADENSIDLLATLVNVNKRLPIVLIITHRDTPDCLIKVKHILGGGNVVGGQHPTGFGALGTVHHDILLDDLSAKGGMSSRPMSKSGALRGTGVSMVVRGGGGVRFIRLQNPAMDTIQEFLAALLHRDKADVVSLAKVLHQKTWLTIRQLVLELYRSQFIYFNCGSREWEWEPCAETLAETVRKRTGEEYAFLNNRFRALDSNTKRALLNVNMGCDAMAGIQSAIREGILVYTSVTDRLRFHHGIMRTVSMSLLEDPEDMERLHFDMTKLLFNTPGHEFQIASHVLQCMNLIKKKLAAGAQTSDALHDALLNTDRTFADGQWQLQWSDSDIRKAVELDTQSLRRALSLAGEKSQKSGAQDKALAYWNAALSLLPDNCWDRPPEATRDAADSDVKVYSPRSFPQSPITLSGAVKILYSRRLYLYNEALRLHIQCIEAERWRENFEQAMKICEVVLSKVADPIDRARVYQHQIEMYVWAYSSPEKAVSVTIRCLHELGMPRDVVFNPTGDEIRGMFDKTHTMLLEHMPMLGSSQPKVCNDPKIAMMMEVLSIASAIVQSMRLTCEHGITKDTGRALVSFALIYSTWFGKLDHVYEFGKLACAVSNGNHHVKFLFYLSVQQWGDHVATSIPALEETMSAVDLTCDRLFHTAGMIHVSVTKVLIGRVPLNDLMTTTIELLSKHIEFGPKSHGIEVMQGILQLIKCLMGRTLASSPESIFEDMDLSDGKSTSKSHSSKKTLTLVHNNSSYQMLKVVAAFIFGHYAYVQEVTDVWHDDPKSIMNFECSWITHSVYTVVGLSLANLLRTETDPVVRKKHKRRLFRIRGQMELHANKYPTNHAAMYYLLEAEIADQGLTPDIDGNDEAITGTRGVHESPIDMMKVLLLYEKAIKYSIEGDFPLHKCFSYELSGKCHLRHGLETNAKCLMANACKVYQTWGAKGKVQWFHNTFPAFFPPPPEVDPTATKRGLFYKPSDNNGYFANRPVVPAGPSNTGTNPNVIGGSTNGSSPWMAGSPHSICSPTTFGPDSVSATAAAMAGSNLASSFQTGCPSATSTCSSTLSAPLYSLHNTWLSSPQTPELDNADLDVLDFSSVIEAMQVIASEIDLDLLLVKSLGVLNQSVGAKQCCVIISKDRKLVLSASQGEMGQCESVKPPMEVNNCKSLFHGVINYVVNTSAPCLLTNAKEDPRFCSDEYLKHQRTDLKTVLCAPILHKAALVGVLYMEDFPERAFANKRMLVMNLLVQQLGISITNALLYQSVLESETKLNELLENMPCGISLWDSAGEKLQYVNSGWSDMTGYTVEEIMTHGFSSLQHPDEMVSNGLAWKERVQEGLPCQWECRYGLKDGTFRWSIVRMLPIMAADNKILQWVTVSIDIDDQRRAVQLKSNFLANMSHELRTPFSGILGMLSLLRDSSGLTHEQFEFVDMAKGSCEMLIRIVDDLLNFSKLEADKVTLEYIPMCFEEILGDVCDLLVPLASKKGLELIILIDIDLPVLLVGDPDRMKQILMNLIGNAIKFSTSGNVVIKYWHERKERDTIKSKKANQSILEILADNCQFDRIRSKVQQDIEGESKLGDEITLHCSVTDQGIGMTQEEQKMLFISFQQTDNGTTRKYGGTGLGLSICAQLIKHMHGKVVVESEKGKGSTFTFTANVRTMTDYDRKQSPVESSRIKECETLITVRWEALKSKRFLILSPNKLLREQVMTTVRGAECMEFDGVQSAVQAGAIGLEDPTGCCKGFACGPTTTPEADMDGMEGVVDNDTHLSSAESGKLRSEGTIRQFDYILVDHVLDSAELDCIYPSPSIAFVLLLAPTTETLRWILPPAQKHLDSFDSDELGSSQVDVGGRGRIRNTPEIECAEKAIGQVRSSSFMSKIRTQSYNPNNLEDHLADGISEARNSPQSFPRPRRPRRPSELFKRKKNSIQSATCIKKRRAPTKPTEVTTQGCPTSKLPDVANVTAGSAVRVSSPPCPSFQVCRMIKPVRRLKLLQILYNALVKHQQQLNGECHDVGGRQTGLMELSEASDGEEEAGFGGDTSLERDRASPRVSDGASMSMSVSSAEVSMKRRISKELPEMASSDRADHDEGQSSSSSSGASSNAGSIGREDTLKNCRPVHKSAKLDAASSPSQLSRSKPRKGKTVDNNMPKRARNNDALTLLLTHEERKRCKGVNVLVAEDDFVSQKILEKQLSKLGMNVMIANNGQEAVDQWLSAEQGHYTIAIFDHHMPIMDGLAATKMIRSLEEEQINQNAASEVSESTEAGTGDEKGKGSKQKQRRIPIVGLSADIQVATKEKCIKAGMDEYMTKPLLTQGLALLIQRYCCD
ncbi:hypothetical protein BGX27_005869 [Mortierella sp. AM989]|nr:hypothetical protein BGX27_005869 [Mortierella sp. AM989]